jgi:hypothetical protein
MQANTKTGAQISDVSAWVLGLGFNLREGRGKDLGPEAGLLGDGGEDGPDARLGLLDRLVGELARHRAHLVVGDGSLGRHGRAAGGLVLGRKLGRHHGLAGRLRRHCARAGSRLPSRAPWRGSGREAAPRVAGRNGRAVGGDWNWRVGDRNPGRVGVGERRQGGRAVEGVGGPAEFARGPGYKSWGFARVMVGSAGPLDGDRAGCRVREEDRVWCVEEGAALDRCLVGRGPKRTGITGDLHGLPLETGISLTSSIFMCLGSSCKMKHFTLNSLRNT